MNLLNLLLSVVYALSIPLMFLLLIAPHELGHFTVGKLCRVRVIEFSIGIGNRLWSRTRNGTLYAIRALPIGGYVRFGGMEPSDFEDPNGFHQKSAPQRLAILFAGAIANLIAAGLLATAGLLLQVNYEPGIVVEVTRGSPADQAGIRPNDQITAVNGKPLEGRDEIRKFEDANPGQPLTLTVRHPNGRAENLTLTSAYNQKNKAWLIGINTKYTYTVPQALHDGAVFPIQTSIGIGAGIYALASGQIPGGLLGPQGATGAVGIATYTYRAAELGVTTWLLFAATLSVALALANLLPVPALDGGRVIVVLLEALRRRPFDRRLEMQVQWAGLIALLALIALIAIVDIQRLATGQFPELR